MCFGIRPRIQVRGPSFTNHKAMSSMGEASSQAQNMTEGDLFSALVTKSNAFPVPFPTSHNRIQSLVESSKSQSGTGEKACHSVVKTVEADARGTRVVVHWRVCRLMGEFLEHKRKWGSGEEKELYRGIDIPTFVTRLIAQRPLSFVGRTDSTLLRNGQWIPSSIACEVWDRVGTRGSIQPLSPPTVSGDSFFLSLQDYLSYDEIQVSALLGTSTPTLFINDGSRNNEGKPGAPGSFEPHGVYLGLVGARFERQGRMEDEWMVLRRPGSFEELPARRAECPEAARERGRMWMRAFGVEEEHWDKVVVPLKESMLSGGGDTQQGRGNPVLGLHPKEEFFFPLGVSSLFHVPLFKARIRLTAETLLLEANSRAGEEGQRAYVHVVGLGLGVWRLLEKQTDWYLSSFAEVIDEVSLPHVGTIDFSYFRGHSRCGRFESGCVTDCPYSGNSIKILFSKREPAAPLAADARTGAKPLLVASYAWDGNSFPGNEYWMGSLSGSGDPAAVCCSTLGALQNPLINEGFIRNIKVLGDPLGNESCSA